MDKELIEQLRTQADEIASAGHAGWGNTMRDAADRLASIDAERGKGVMGEVKKYSGSLGDIAIIVWRGDPPPFGTKLYASPPPAVPEGWALVPVEPTQEMIDHMADERFVELASGKGYTFADMYRAMLAAAKENAMLTDERIKKAMRKLNYDKHCCNSYWPMEFARAIASEVRNRQQRKLGDACVSWGKFA